MRFSLWDLFAGRIRPFFCLAIFAVFVVLGVSWPVDAQGDLAFDVTAVVGGLPEVLAGYDLFTADSGDGWAYLTFVQWEGAGQGEILGFQIALGEYHETAGGWRVYGEGTAEYMTALPRLPGWLQWLAQLEGQRDRGSGFSGSGTYSIPGLPWKPDASWRYNQGPVTPNHLNAFDFGVPVNGVEDVVYAAEDGIVIGTNGTCIIIERPSDGLRHFYQHINSSDIFEFSFGEPVIYKQYIGRTTVFSGCGGTSTGHHVHFAFYTPFGGPIMNPQGFIMNGWQVVGNSLVKGDVTANPNFTDPVLHDGTVFYDEFSEDWLSPEWFWVRENEANWTLLERPDFLRIYPQDGTLQESNVLPENLMLRAAMRSDYELITRFEGAFTENFQEAILVLYQDDDNYVAVGRLYDNVNYGGDVYTFWREENGEVVEPVFSAEAGESDTELRLVVNDTFVIGYYQNEEGEWISIGSFAIDGIELYPSVGVSAYRGVTGTDVGPAVVDFDFVLGRPIETENLYLPSVQFGS